MKKTKKNQRLKMSFGTANSLLRKKILFSLAVKLQLNVYYQCGEVIKNEKDFSIEHKISWLNSDNPIKLFFDLNNIAFSRLSCNCGSANMHRRRQCKSGYSWCYKCKKELKIKNFSKDKSRISDLCHMCKKCKKNSR